MKSPPRHTGYSSSSCSGFGLDWLRLLQSYQDFCRCLFNFNLELQHCLLQTKKPDFLLCPPVLASREGSSNLCPHPCLRPFGCQPLLDKIGHLRPIGDACWNRCPGKYRTILHLKMALCVIREFGLIWLLEASYSAISYHFSPDCFPEPSLPLVLDATCFHLTTESNYWRSSAEALPSCFAMKAHYHNSSFIRHK